MLHNLRSPPSAQVKKDLLLELHISSVWKLEAETKGKGAEGERMCVPEAE